LGEIVNTSLAYRHNAVLLKLQGVHRSSILQIVNNFFLKACQFSETINVLATIVPQSAPQSFVKSRLYEAFSAKRAEILRHKWIESEKAGRDIGFDDALIDWTVHHHAAWRRACIARFKTENAA
jgi:hypothetical protein